MKIETIKTSALIPYARNAKRHDPVQISKLAGSIREFGFNNPVLIDSENGIIAGHGRVMAAQKLAFDSVPCIRLGHLNDAQRRAYILADNRLAEIGGGWDEEMLKLELADLGDMDVDLDAIGFGLEDLEEMEIAGEEEKNHSDAEPQTDKADELVQKWGVKTGQLWELGDHRLLCGDSTRAEDVDRVMGGEKAELLFTSPPYSDMREYDGKTDVSVLKVVNFIEAFAKHVSFFAINLGIKRDNGEVVEYWQEYITVAKSSNLKLLSWNVWDRSACGFSVGAITAMFAIQHEFIFVFGRQVKKLNLTVENKEAGLLNTHIGQRQADGTTKKQSNTIIRARRQLGTVQTINTQLARNETTAHPAMFPIALPLEYISAITQPNEIVAEPFSGSGTTIIACEQLGRKCRAIEISPAYVAVAIQRWADATGKEPKLIGT